MRAAVFALTALLAGCFTPPEGAQPGATPNWRVTGDFAANATQADLDHAAAIVVAHAGSMQLAQTQPVGFVAGGLTQGACAAVARELAAEPRIARVASCEPVGVA